MSDDTSGSVTLNLSAEEAETLTRQLAGDIETLKEANRDDEAEVLESVMNKTFSSQR